MHVRYSKDEFAASEIMGRGEDSGGDGFSGAGFGAADHWKVGRNAKIASAPMAHVSQHGNEVIAGFGEVVGDLRRRGRFDLAMDHAVPFKLTQLRGEHFFADAGEQVAKFRETTRHEAKMPDNQHLPFTA